MSQSSSSSSSAASSIQLAAVAVACTAAGIAGGLYYGHKYVCSRPQGPLKKRGDSPLWEYSVIYTDRAYNLMSTPFQAAMRDISASLKKVYNADSLAIIPGSGTYAMESVARQFGTGKRCLVIRNGYFSYRWSDIFEVTKILPQTETVCYARPVAGQEKEARPQFAPCPLTEVVAEIKRSKPAVVFAPHVETSLGILLPDTYIAAVADAVHSYGGVFVLDAIAAGNVWCDMKKTG